LSVPSLTLGVGHEVQGVRDDGSTMTLDLRLAEWQSVTTKMYTSILRDITAGILIEQQLAQSHKIEVIGRLTSGMAHDFNNILAVAIGNLDLLAEHYADDALPIEITESLFALTGGAALVQRLLAFARRQPLQSQPTNLKVVINALMPLLLRTISAQITIDVAIRDDLALVLVDPIQFENALLNLVLNARDALSQGGKVTIACENFSMDEFSAEAYHTAIGQYVIVAVSDNGHGIPADILSRVFDPFFTTKPVGTGSGLGLSMVFGFVKQSGGVCHIYSEVGIGTTVRLYFPAALDATLPLPVMVDDSDSALFGNERILVVEDTAAARSVAERVLRSLGYHVDSVSDSAEAIDLLELGRYDMLFTDIIMPGPMDGLALAKYVHGRYPAMKIVLLSGFSVTLSADVTALDAVYVTKPYRKSVLAKLLRQQFSESQTV
jgi:signal transduction histidine kinase/CheY-like chemotaxis protein